MVNTEQSERTKRLEEDLEEMRICHAGEANKVNVLEAENRELKKETARRINRAVTEYDNLVGVNELRAKLKTAMDGIVSMAKDHRSSDIMSDTASDLLRELVGKEKADELITAI